MEIISISGQYDGLREDKQNCINFSMSKFNGNSLKIVKLDNVRVIRFLIDAKCKDERKLFKYLRDLQLKNPDIEFHINIEFDRFFEDAKRIMNRVGFVNKSITLWADSELKDRSYLNLSNLPCKTIIPLQYAMWHSKIEQSDSSKLYFSREDMEVRDGSIPFSEKNKFTINGNKKEWSKGSNIYRLNDVLKIKRIVLEVLNTELSDLQVCSLAPDQKILVVMKYLVDNYTYTETPNIGTMKILNLEYSQNAGDVLKTKQGICKGIAEAYMLLLNNPIVCVDCRVLGGLVDKNDPNSGHAWNIIRLQDESKYRIDKHVWLYMDPSHNVELKDCFAYSFLKASDMSRRALYDGINPEYKDSVEVLFNREILKARLRDALLRIQKVKDGKRQFRIITPLEDIPKFGK